MVWIILHPKTFESEKRFVHIKAMNKNYVSFSDGFTACIREKNNYIFLAYDSFKMQEERASLDGTI